MTTLLNKELKSYFTSPIGYVFMCFFLLIFGLYFTAMNVANQNGDYTYVISSLSNMLLFTVPILTMRLLSEERKNRTDQLLITAPITVSSIVLGKYLAAVLLLLITLAITFIHPLLLMTVGTIPLTSILCSYLGFFLLGCTLISIGLFISALTENQIVAAIGTIGAFMFLLLADGIATLIPTSRTASLIFVFIIIIIVSLVIYNAMKDIYISLFVAFIAIIISCLLFYFKGEFFDGLPTKFLQWFSVYGRFDSFVNGLLDVSAIIYYLSFIGVFLFLTKQIIEKRSWS